MDSQELEEILTIFFNALPDPIYIIDETGFVLKRLGGTRLELDITHNQLEGNNISSILPKPLIKVFKEVIAKSIQSNLLECIEYQVNEAIDPGKDEHWYEGRVFPLAKRNNDKRAVVWVVIDITEKKKLEMQLTELVEKDSLTGVKNRRFFTRAMNYNFSRYKRNKAPFCILILDIDYFKMINDNFGHDAGDKVLIALSCVFQEVIRDIDVLARYGGEEFVFLLPDTSLNQASIVADRVREASASSSLIYDNKKITVTVSIGLSEVSEDDSSIEQMLKRADNALYKAKENGRNRVCV